MDLHLVRRIPLLLLLACPGSALATPDADSLREAADEKVERRDYSEAIKLYKQALKSAGESWTLCQIGLARAYNGLGAHKNAIESAEAAIGRAKERNLLAVAWNQKALAQFAAAESDAGKLAVAEQSFRKVYELDPAPIVRFNLGVVLLRQGRDTEGAAELEAFLSEAPGSPKADAARDMLENPRRARERMLPSLELVTLTGDYISNEDLLGRVVLLDFWGTWCEPCRMAVPSLKALVERSTKSPLTVISIATDQDDVVLKEFISGHGMSWPQVWDRDHKIVRSMSVSSYPTYILADHEGKIVFRYSGWGDQVESAIQRELRRAVTNAKRATSPGS